MTLPLDVTPFFSGSGLNYTASGLPAGLSIASGTGLISGTPTQAEIRPVTVTASNTAGSAQQNFTWTITASATVPDQVTGLTATPGDGQIQLDWNVPGNGGSAITDYVIERSVGGGAFAPLADGLSTVPEFTDTGLANGVEHRYRVATVNGVGQGPTSAIAIATPAAASGGADLAVLAFAHGETGSVAQSVSTFAGLQTAPGDVILSVTHRGSPDNNQVTAVTVSGTAATLIGRQYVTGQTKQEQSVWHAPVTGATADVVVTTAAATARMGVALWSVGEIDTGGIVFVSDTAGGVSSLTENLDVPAGGLILGHATVIGAGASISWTGLDAQIQTEASPNYWHAAASRAFPAAVSGQGVTAAFGGNFNNTILTVVSFGS